MKYKFIHKYVDGFHPIFGCIMRNREWMSRYNEAESTALWLAARRAAGGYCRTSALLKMRPHDI